MPRGRQHRHSPRGLRNVVSGAVTLANLFSLSTAFFSFFLLLFRFRAPVVPVPPAALLVGLVRACAELKRAGRGRQPRRGIRPGGRWPRSCCPVRRRGGGL